MSSWGGSWGFPTAVSLPFFKDENNVLIEQQEIVDWQEAQSVFEKEFVIFLGAQVNEGK